MVGENIKCFALVQIEQLKILFFESLNIKEEENYRKEINYLLKTRVQAQDISKSI